MEIDDEARADALRADIAHRKCDPTRFRRELLRVAPFDRDAWVDRVLGVREIPADSPLPKGCVPYLPCSVDAIVRVVDSISFENVARLVDIGSGAGRAAALFHLITGVSVVGVEIQPLLVRSARESARQLGFSNVSFIEGDVSNLPDGLPDGDVFFLYCPFGGERLAAVMRAIESIAHTKSVHVVTVDLPPLAQSWLEKQRIDRDVVVYRSMVKSA